MNRRARQRTGKDKERYREKRGREDEEGGGGRSWSAGGRDKERTSGEGKHM